MKSMHKQCICMLSLAKQPDFTSLAMLTGLCIKREIIALRQQCIAKHPFFNDRHKLSNVIVNMHQNTMKLMKIHEFSSLAMHSIYMHSISTFYMVFFTFEKFLIFHFFYIYFLFYFLFGTY